MLHPHVAPKNGCKKEHATSSILFRPFRVSHNRAPHDFVTVLFPTLRSDIFLSGRAKIPEPGQRSQVAGTFESSANSSEVDCRNRFISDGGEEDMLVGSVDS